MVLIQIVIGGIGFPLIYDVIEKIKCKKKGQIHKFTLFSKVALISYFSVAVLTAAAAFAFEFGYSGFQNAGMLSNDSTNASATALMSVPIYDIAHYKEYAHEFGKNVMFNKC
jgi:Trk-type K+ transport system membrane component